MATAAMLATAPGQPTTLWKVKSRLWPTTTLTIDTLEKRRSVPPWSRHRRAGNERGLETTAPQPNDGPPNVTVLRGIHPV